MVKELFRLEMERCGTKMKKQSFKKIICILVVASTISVFVACENGSKNTMGIPTEQKVVKQEVEASGIVNVRESKNINIEFSAVISNVNVKEGQKVKSGDVLLSLDLTDYNSQIKAKESEHYVETLQLQNLQKVPDSDTKDNNIKMEREKVELLNNSLESIRSKLNKSYMQDNNIVSDVANGVVYDIGYQNGDIVSPAKKVLSIKNLDTMYIQADVAEEFIKDVKVGAYVTIVATADASKEFKGKVTKIYDMAMQKNNQTIVPIEISVDNKDGFLLPNFNVEVKISK